MVARTDYLTLPVTPLGSDVLHNAFLRGQQVRRGVPNCRWGYQESDALIHSAFQMKQMLAGLIDQSLPSDMPPCAEL